MRIRPLVKMISCLALCCPMLMAQDREERKQIEYKYNKVSIEKAFKINEFTAPDGRGTGAIGFRDTVREKWQEFEVKFSIDAITRSGKVEWLDDVTFEWEVAIFPKKSKKSSKSKSKSKKSSSTKPVILKKKVTYVDVKVSNKELYATVYISPRFVDRYLGTAPKITDVAIRLDLKHNGESILKKGEPVILGKSISSSFWSTDEDRLMEVKNPELVLHSKDETPFANFATDNYLTVKRGEEE